MNYFTTILAAMMVTELVFLSSFAVHAEPVTARTAPIAPALADLAGLQWDHRIIVVSGVENTKNVVDLFEQNKSKINERDIIWFVVEGEQLLTNYAGPLTKDFLTNIRRQYPISPAKVMLIGKDGGVKFLLDQLDLAALFSEIDAMPMRQSEMLH